MAAAERHGTAASTRRPGDEFGRRVAAEARPIDDHRSTAAYRRHAVGVLAARAAAAGGGRVSEHYGLTRQRRRARGPRRLGRREPALRAARAARPAGRQGRVRAGRVRLVLGRSSTARWCARASCSRPSAVGREITTVEGLAPDGALSDVQQAFVDEGAVQCGFCTPGLIVAVHDLLDREPDARPTSRSARRSRATSAAAPATAASSRRCKPRPRERTARDRHRDDRLATRVVSDRAASARARPGPTASPRCRVASRSPPTSGPTACCGAPTLRSPHPYARIRAASTSSAGVADPRRRGGPHRRRRARRSRPTASSAQDQPVFAADVVRYVGRAGRRRRRRPSRDVPAGAARRSSSTTRCSSRSSIPRRRSPAATRRSIPTATCSATSASCAATRTSPATSWSRAPTRSACRTRRSSASRRRWRCPTRGGAGVELFIATQWLHEDREQIAACLGLPEEQVRLTLGGVGGAFGAREDVSLQVHVLPARAAHRPAGEDAVRPRGELPRPRAPAPGPHLDAPPRRPPTARIVKIEARFVLDGGAYASTSSAVLVNAITHAQGPYRCPNAVVDGWAVRTNNPPCGAMRGFGVRAGLLRPREPDGQARGGVRPRPGRDPAAQRDARPATGSSPARSSRAWRPSARCIRETAALPLPAEPVGGYDGDPMRLPGRRRAAPPTPATCGAASASRVAIKNLMYSEGFDDYSTARCRLADGVATLKFATAEVGQGFVTIAQQIARDGPRRRRGRARADRHRRSARPGRRRRRARRGCRAARSTPACRAVRERLFEHVGRSHGRRPGAAGDRGHRRRRHRWAALRVPVAEATAGAARSRRPSSTTTAPTERARRARPGRLPHGVRLRRPSRRRRRRPRARPREGGADRHRPGRRPGAQPAVGRRPDRGRHRPGPRPGRDGGDRRRRTAASATRRSPTTCCRPFLDAPDVRGRRSSRSPIRRRRSAPRAWASRRASR